MYEPIPIYRLNRRRPIRRYSRAVTWPLAVLVSLALWWGFLSALSTAYTTVQDWTDTGVGCLDDCLELADEAHTIDAEPIREPEED